MVAKVVGKAPEHVKRVTCRNCASIIEYTLADTEVRTTPDYTGDCESYRSLICPACQSRISVSLY